LDSGILQLGVGLGEQVGQRQEQVGQLIALELGEVVVLVVALQVEVLGLLGVQLE
jgi:hypothetical protein